MLLLLWDNVMTFDVLKGLTSGCRGGEEKLPAHCAFEEKRCRMVAFW